MSPRLPVALLLALAAGPLGAAPQPASLFQDHAVLQRDRRLPVWGTAVPGEHVTVAFAGQSVGTTAGADGRWMVVLEPLGANPTGADLQVAGSAAVVLHDVVVGDVWLCGGQSNMEFTVDNHNAVYRVENAAAEVAAATFPLIRQFKVGRRASAGPVETAAGDWQPCSPATVGQFTAVGYFFARDLFNRLQVPMGLINCTWAGTPIASWQSPAARAALPPPPPGGAGRPLPGALFNGMVHPLLPYGLRGILWYQGESDVGRAAAYAAEFPELIRSWRAHFGQDDLPFFWVQLANFGAGGDPGGRSWAYLREAQARALALPQTGQALAIDLGERNNIQPHNKQEVGRRLALLAKSQVYGIAVDSTGPLFDRLEPAGAAVRVRFKSAAEGLTAGGRPLQAFEVAGADRRFYPAQATIEGDTVVLRAPQVPQPVAVRYAWTNDPDANLYGGSGLPAAPFRTDDW